MFVSKVNRMTQIVTTSLSNLKNICLFIMTFYLHICLTNSVNMKYYFAWMEGLHFVLTMMTKVLFCKWRDAQ